MRSWDLPNTPPWKHSCAGIIKKQEFLNFALCFETMTTYRKQLIAGIALLLLILAAFPFFFQTIEHRKGMQLNDWILNVLPPRDLSLPIFLVIWATLALLLVRAYRDPQLLIQYVWAFFFLCLARMISISVVKLDSPRGLIPLIDPVGNFFYGKSFVTRDLFFSGHTGTVFMMFLCFRRKADKLFAAVTSLLTAVFLLIQHVHYTVDVVGAMVFSLGIYWVVSRMFPVSSSVLTNA